MPPQVICVWLPNWPCQRLHVTRTVELARQPFALQARDPRRGWRVMATDSLARQQRIFPGMSLSEAVACLPELRLLDYDPQEDLAALMELAQAAWQFSPIVGLESLDSQLWAGRSLHQPQAFFLDATGITHLFDSPHSMLVQVEDWLYRQGYIAVVAMAPTLGAAWAIANYAHRSQAAENLLAERRQVVSSSDTEHELPQNSNATLRLSTSLVSMVEPVETLAAHLAGFPVEALRCDSKTLHTLHQLGIRTLDALLQLPRAGLASRLGDFLLERIDMACYGRSEVIRELREQMACSAEINLEFPTAHRETLQELIGRLIRQLCDALRQHGQGVLRLTACLRLEHGPARLVTLGLYRATADEQHLLPLLWGALENEVFNPRKRPGIHATCQVTAIVINASLTGPLVWKQPELFDAESQRYHQIMARHIDHLASRLGRRQVVTAQLQRHPQPELVNQWRPLTGIRRDGQPQTTRRKLARGPSTNHQAISANEEATHGPSTADRRQYNRLAPSSEDPMRRPLQLFQPPEAMDIQRYSDDGVPRQFSWKHGSHEVVNAWGPERIESGWWDAALQRRDYYRVETRAGIWLWIYRDLNQKRWLVHGIF